MGSIRLVRESRVPALHLFSSAGPNVATGRILILKRPSQDLYSLIKLRYKRMKASEGENGRVGLKCAFKTMSRACEFVSRRL